MTITDDDVMGLAEEIWESLLELSIQRIPDASDVDDAATMTACIQFTGSWEGSLSIYCGDEFVRLAAGRMFASDPDGLSTEDVEDALGEIANVAGGNLKSLLPVGAEISLPTVVRGDRYAIHFPGSSVIASVPFECEGQPIRIVVFRRCSDDDKTSTAAAATATQAGTT